MYLNTRDAGDIAITAAEGGIGYWSQIATYRPSRWTREDARTNQQVRRDFVFYTLAEWDGGDYNWNHPYDVTPFVLQKGLDILIMNVKAGKMHPYGFDVLDFGSYDSDVCDVIVQLGLFGEVKYG